MSDLELAREAVHDALMHRTHGVRSGGGTDGQRVWMSVMSRDEPIAREMHQRFGHLVDLEVAWQPYPFPASPVAPPLAPSLRANAGENGVQVRTVLDKRFRRSIRCGHILTGHLEIRNVMDHRIDWRSDSMYDADIGNLDGTVMNLRNAHGAGTGRNIILNSGASCERPFLASTDSRDARLGPALPPGEYQLFVPIPVYGTAAGELREITCPPVLITLK